MSGEKQNELLSFGEILMEVLGAIAKDVIQSGTKISVGDKIVLENKNVVTYLVPITTGETIGKNMERHNKGLSKYFTEVEGEVTHVEQDFIYNCGHCSKEHKHDLVIYYKELGQSFYISSDAVTTLDK